MIRTWIPYLSAGVLLIFSFPPFSVPVLSFGAFFLIYKELQRDPEANQIHLKIYTAMLIWNAGTTYWLCMATVLGGVAAILANSLVMAVPLILTRKLFAKSWSTVHKILGSASLWILMEILHHRWDLAWPWLSLGNAFSVWPDTVQFISITGFSGISLWVILVAVSFSFSIQRTRPLLLSVLVLAPLIISLTLKFSYRDQFSENIRVAVIQPNLDSYLPHSGFDNDRELTRYVASKVDSLIETDRPELIFLPENALPGVQRLDFRTRNQRILAEAVTDSAVSLITGSALYVSYEKEPAYPTRHTSYNVAYDIFNAALQFQGGEVKDVYRKRNLVPIIEQLPFRDFFVPLLDRWVDFDPVLGFGPGDSDPTLFKDSTSFAMAICYDSVFGNFLRKSIKNGASFIGVITNDGWWGHSPGHIQHFEFGRLRALENRRFVIRSANNGISGLISPTGEILKETTFWTQDAFTVNIPIESKQLTFYSRFGDWLLFPALFISAWVFLVAAFKES